MEYATYMLLHTITSNLCYYNYVHAYISIVRQCRHHAITIYMQYILGTKYNPCDSSNIV